MITREQYERWINTRNVVGLTIHVDDEPVMITRQEYGHISYKRADGLEYSMRESHLAVYMAHELARQLWPEMKA